MGTHGPRHVVSLMAVCAGLMLACIPPAGSTTDGTDVDGDQPPDGTASSLAVFQDPDSDFSTSDVYDANSDIVRFDAEARTIIWRADDTPYQAGAWDVSGNLLYGGFFTIRFGTLDGVPRAYLTETANATDICDVFVVDGVLGIVPTANKIPHT